MIHVNIVFVFSQICSHVAAYTNSCLNPILYAKMSRNFRCGFSQVGKEQVIHAENYLLPGKGSDISGTQFAIHLKAHL